MFIDQKQLSSNNKKKTNSTRNFLYVICILLFIEYKVPIMNIGIVMLRESPAISPKIGIIKIRLDSINYTPAVL